MTINWWQRSGRARNNESNAVELQKPSSASSVTVADAVVAPCDGRGQLHQSTNTVGTDERRIDPKVQTHFAAEYDEHANGFFSAPE
jgi:nucleoside-specific outer membrane channel protein Tsx